MWGHLWQKLIRATIVALAALTFVTPAAAQVGCFDGCVAELEADRNSDAAEESSASAPGRENDSGTTVRCNHCLSGNGCCAAVAPASEASLEAAAGEPIFLSAPPLPLTPASGNGPLRPPRS